MIKNIYSVHDRLIGYINIILDDNDDVAMRNFTNSVKNSHSVMYVNPEDFSLYRHGQFDTATGNIITHEPVCVLRAIDLKLDHINNEEVKDV